MRAVEDGGSPGSGRYSSLARDNGGRLHLMFRTEPGFHGAAAYATASDSGWAVVDMIEPETGGDIDDVALDASVDGVLHAAAYDIGAGALLYRDLAAGAAAPVEVVVDAGGIHGIALAADRAGVPRLAFHARSATGDVLRLATRKAASWTFEDLDEDDASAGYSPSLVIDDTARAHVVHGRFGLRYTAGTSGAWTTETVGDEGRFGKLAVASDGTLHVAYVTGTEVRHAWRDPQGTWQVSVIDHAAIERDGTGTWGPAIALDANDRAHVTYYVRHDATDDRRVAVRYARRGDSGWELSTIREYASIDRDYQSSLVIDAAGVPHVVFHDGDAQHARHVTCDAP